MPHTHHAIDYIEINVPDEAGLVRAKAFYGSVFGWEFTDYAPVYAGIRDPSGAEEVGGLSVGGEISAGSPLVLLWSQDLDASAQAVRDGGGEVIQEPYAFPGGRRFHFADPSGNHLGVWSQA